MRFGDAVTVTTSTGSRLAVYLWRPAGCQPSIFLDGRVVQPDLDAILVPWSCPTCHGSHLFWGPRIQVRCATCQPPTTREKEFIMLYAIGAVQHLADKLDDPAGKAAMYRLLDEAIASGDLRQLVRLSLEMLAGSFILKHELGDLL
jgi:hypothetical protein